MKINLKVRFHNPVFWVQIGLSILLPIMTYYGLTAQDITSWPLLGKMLWDAVQNPYVLATVAISVWNALTDPTTEGLGDSARALTYEKPSK